MLSEKYPGGQAWQIILPPAEPSVHHLSLLVQAVLEAETQPVQKRLLLKEFLQKRKENIIQLNRDLPLRIIHHRLVTEKVIQVPKNPAPATHLPDRIEVLIPLHQRVIRLHIQVTAAVVRDHPVHFRLAALPGAAHRDRAVQNPVRAAALREDDNKE